MSRLELTQLHWAGLNLRQVGPVVVESDDIIARASTNRHSVLYLRSGEKVLVLESLEGDRPFGPHPGGRTGSSEAIQA